VARAAAVRIAGDDAAARWCDAGPVHLAGAFGARLSAHRAEIARTLAMFRRLRAGGAFHREMERRCGSSRRIALGGVSRDLGDDREIEKVHADVLRRGRPAARDVWAKLSWISADPRDDSLRIRFSFGSERLDDWSTDPRRARAADELAQAAFPECALLAAGSGPRRRLEAWTGGPVRLSERIVFSNAPGGGAVFHDDAEEGQLGVAYAQLAGRTAWLAVAKRELAREIARLAARGTLRSEAGTEARALRAMDAPSPALRRLLDRSARLTRRLVEAGHLYVLAPGDALLLPSHGPDDAAWHSVFAPGRAPSLAHSFGVFAERRRRRR
jgi:hypothetical protein